MALKLRLGEKRKTKVDRKDEQEVLTDKSRHKLKTVKN